MDPGFVLILVLFAALAIVGMYFAHRQQSRRVAELGALAQRLGWRFEPARDSSHSDRFAHFGVFCQGHSRAAFNTLLGALEFDGQMWPAQAGDFTYKTTSHNGKSTQTHTHYLSYAIIETPHLGAPDLSIRREGVLDRVKGFFGFDDIDFESHEFSERFHVKSADKRFAYAVIDPRMMEFLLDGDPPEVEFRRGQCCLTRRSKRWSAQEIADALEWARAFFGRWPKHVASALEG